MSTLKVDAITSSEGLVITTVGGDGVTFNEKLNVSELNVTTSDENFILKGNDGGSIITALTVNMAAAGAATFNNDVTAFSDKRLKTDISNIENGLDKVMQMQGVQYKRNDVKNAQKQIGVLAQDMEAILPEIVLTADDEMQTKSGDYGKITAVLIEAIKELKAEIDELKRK